jgi:hypothetical protein
MKDMGIVDKDRYGVEPVAISNKGKQVKDYPSITLYGKQIKILDLPKELGKKVVIKAVVKVSGFEASAEYPERLSFKLVAAEICDEEAGDIDEAEVVSEEKPKKKYSGVKSLNLVD